MRTIKKLIILLIAITFLTPLIGDSALSESLGDRIFEFDHHDSNEEWETYPQDMVNGCRWSYAITTIDGDVELCDENECDESFPETITKVEIQAIGMSDTGIEIIILRPVFNGTTDGDDYPWRPDNQYPFESEWFDITYDDSAPETWTWENVENLDCDVESKKNIEPKHPWPDQVWYCSMVRIRVTYTN